MKVYIVTCENEVGRDVVKVFADKRKAKDYVDKYKKICYKVLPQIEVHNIEEDVCEIHELITVIIDHNNKDIIYKMLNPPGLYSKNECTFSDSNFGCSKGTAPTYELALKLAVEARQRYLRESK